MPYPHVIRLRGPWEYEPLVRFTQVADGTASEDRNSLPPPGRVQVPVDWPSILGADFSGRVRYRRNFNRPTGLEAHDQVWLVVEGNTAYTRIKLHANSVGQIAQASASASFDITRLIANRNELVMEVDGPLACDIRLEIRGDER